MCGLFLSAHAAKVDLAVLSLFLSSFDSLFCLAPLASAAAAADARFPTALHEVFIQPKRPSGWGEGERRADSHATCVYSTCVYSACLGLAFETCRTMLHSAPTQSRPDRLCVGVSPRTRKVIYFEGFGEWICDDGSNADSSNNEWDESGFSGHLKEKNQYWWEWDFGEVVACEVEMLHEREKEEQEALRVEQEDGPHLAEVTGHNARAVGHSLVCADG